MTNSGTRGKQPSPDHTDEKGDARRVQKGKAPQTMGQRHHLDPDKNQQRGSKVDRQH